MSDFILSYHGTLWLLVPCTSQAKDWSAANLAGVLQPPWGGAVVIECRYIEDIALGILDHGMTVEHRTTRATQH